MTIFVPIIGYVFDKSHKITLPPPFFSACAACSSGSGRLSSSSGLLPFHSRRLFVARCAIPIIPMRCYDRKLLLLPQACCSHPKLQARCGALLSISLSPPPTPPQPHTHQVLPRTLYAATMAAASLLCDPRPLFPPPSAQSTRFGSSISPPTTQYPSDSSLTPPPCPLQPLNCRRQSLPGVKECGSRRGASPRSARMLVWRLQCLR